MAPPRTARAETFPPLNPTMATVNKKRTHPVGRLRWCLDRLNDAADSCLTGAGVRVRYSSWQKRSVLWYCTPAMFMRIMPQGARHAAMHGPKVSCRFLCVPLHGSNAVGLNFCRTALQRVDDVSVAGLRLWRLALFRNKLSCFFQRSIWSRPSIPPCLTTITEAAIMVPHY